MTRRRLSVWSNNPLCLPADLIMGDSHHHHRAEQQGSLVHQGGVLLCWCCPHTIEHAGRPTLFIHRRINFN